VGKLDLKTLCQRCRLVRRWRRDGSRNEMSLAAGLDNLVHQRAVCVGRSLDDSQPTPEQMAELKQRFQFDAQALLELLEGGDMLGTWTAEWWLMACEECRTHPADRPTEDADAGTERIPGQEFAIAVLAQSPVA